LLDFIEVRISGSELQKMEKEVDEHEFFKRAILTSYDLLTSLEE